MSSDDLMRKARLAALREASGGAAPPPMPATKKSDDALVSDDTKAALKTAGALAGMAGKWGLGKAKQAAVATVEKTKQVQDAAAQKLDAAKRAREDEAVKRTGTSHPEPAVGSVSVGVDVSDGMSGMELDAEAGGAPLGDLPPEVIESVQDEKLASGNQDGSGALSPEPPSAEARAVAHSVLEDAGYDLTTTDSMSVSLALALEEIPANNLGVLVADAMGTMPPTVEDQLAAFVADPEFVAPTEDSLGEPAPLPDDTYSEEPTGSTEAPVRRRAFWPWVVGGVVCLGALAYVALGPKDAAPVPSSASTPEAVISPAVVTPAPVVEVPADVEEQPEPVVVEESVVDEPTPAPAIAPAPPAVSPQPVVVEQLTAPVEPVATPKPPRAEPRAAAPAAPRPAPRPIQRAPVAPAQADPQWQDKAKQDMDQWARDMGIE